MGSCGARHVAGPQRRAQVRPRRSSACDAVDARRLSACCRPLCSARGLERDFERSDFRQVKRTAGGANDPSVGPSRRLRHEGAGPGRRAHDAGERAVRAPQGRRKRSATASTPAGANDPTVADRVDFSTKPRGVCARARRSPMRCTRSSRPSQAVATACTAAGANDSSIGPSRRLRHEAAGPVRRAHVARQHAARAPQGRRATRKKCTKTSAHHPPAVTSSACGTASRGRCRAGPPPSACCHRPHSTRG